MPGSKFVKIPHVNFERTSQLLFKLCIILIVVKHIIIHFKIWIKRPHQSPNFETLKCSGKNLVNSLCDFPNHKSVFFRFCITHQCHERKLFCTFFSSNNIYFPQKESIKVKNFETFECSS